MTMKEVSTAEHDKLVADGKLKVPGQKKTDMAEKKEKALEEQILDYDIPMVEGRGTEGPSF